jgi:hypothetical protein
MATDHNPFIVIDMITFDKVQHALELAVCMSEKQFPHLTKELKDIQKASRDRAKSFLGSHNVPKCAKEAYNYAKKGGTV